MTSHLAVGALAATLCILLANAALAEDMRLNGPVTDIFGDRIVVQSDGKKHLVNLGPKAGELRAVKVGDTVRIEGDLKRSGEIRAQNVTLADGKAVVVGKGQRSWRQWLSGDDKKFQKGFTAADAKKLAVDKGYILGSDPVSEKRHFTTTATKGSETVELDIFRDGKLVERKPFSASEATTLITGKGYEIVGQPARKKEHFEALAKKSSKHFEVHAYRDGKVVEKRVVEKTDAKWGSQIR